MLLLRGLSQLCSVVQLSLVFFFSPDVCASAQAAASGASEHAGIRIVCDWIPFHLVTSSAAQHAEHDAALYVRLFLPTTSFSVRSVEFCLGQRNCLFITWILSLSLLEVCKEGDRGLSLFILMLAPGTGNDSSCVFSLLWVTFLLFLLQS